MPLHIRIIVRIVRSMVYNLRYVDGLMRILLDITIPICMQRYEKNLTFANASRFFNICHHHIPKLPKSYATVNSSSSATARPTPSKGKKWSNHHNAATRGMPASHERILLSLRAVWRLYLVCMYISASAGISNAASNINAELVVSGRWPFSISFSTVYDMFTCRANERCWILRASNSSFITSPGWVAYAPFPNLAIVLSTDNGSLILLCCKS